MTLSGWRELETPGDGPSQLFFQSIDQEPKQSLVKLDDDDDNELNGDAEEEPTKVTMNDTVLIDITGRQADSHDHRDGPIFLEAQSWLVGAGDPFVLPRALEWALLQTKEKETVLLYIDAKSRHHPYQYVNRTYKSFTLPEDSNLFFEIKVSQIVMDTSRLNPYFSLQKALTWKKIANDLYQNEWELKGKQTSGKNSRERAIHLYEKATKSMQTLLKGTYFASVEPDHPQRKECQDILMDSMNNMIAVYLRAKRFEKAREAARNALKEDSKNPKSHLRNVKAHVLDNRCGIEEAEKAINKAEEFIQSGDPEEKELKQLKAKLSARNENRMQ